MGLDLDPSALLSRRFLLPLVATKDLLKKVEVTEDELSLLHRSLVAPSGTGASSGPEDRANWRSVMETLESQGELLGRLSQDLIEDLELVHEHLAARIGIPLLIPETKRVRAPVDPSREIDDIVHEAQDAAALARKATDDNDAANPKRTWLDERFAQAISFLVRQDPRLLAETMRLALKDAIQGEVDSFPASLGPVHEGRAASGEQDHWRNLWESDWSRPVVFPGFGVALARALLVVQSAADEASHNAWVTAPTGALLRKHRFPPKRASVATGEATSRASEERGGRASEKPTGKDGHSALAAINAYIERLETPGLSYQAWRDSELHRALQLADEVIEDFLGAGGDDRLAHHLRSFLRDLWRHFAPDAPLLDYLKQSDGGVHDKIDPVWMKKVFIELKERWEPHAAWDATAAPIDEYERKKVENSFKWFADHRLNRLMAFFVMMERRMRGMLRMRVLIVNERLMRALELNKGGGDPLVIHLLRRLRRHQRRFKEILYAFSACLGSAQIRAAMAPPRAPGMHILTDHARGRVDALLHCLGEEYNAAVNKFLSAKVLDPESPAVPSSPLRMMLALDYVATGSALRQGDPTQTGSLSIRMPITTLRLPTYFIELAHELAHGHLSERDVERVRSTPTDRRAAFSEPLRSMVTSVTRLVEAEMRQLNPESHALRSARIVAESLADFVAVIVGGPHYVIALASELFGEHDLVEERRHRLDAMIRLEALMAGLGELTHLIESRGLEWRGWSMARAEAVQVGLIDQYKSELRHLIVAGGRDRNEDAVSQRVQDALSSLMTLLVLELLHPIAPVEAGTGGAGAGSDMDEWLLSIPGVCRKRGVERASRTWTAWADACRTLLKLEPDVPDLPGMDARWRHGLHYIWDANLRWHEERVSGIRRGLQLSQGQRAANRDGSTQDDIQRGIRELLWNRPPSVRALQLLQDVVIDGQETILVTDRVWSVHLGDVPWKPTSEDGLTLDASRVGTDPSAFLSESGEQLLNKFEAYVRPPLATAADQTSRAKAERPLDSTGSESHDLASRPPEAGFDGSTKEDLLFWSYGPTDLLHMGPVISVSESLRHSGDLHGLGSRRGPPFLPWFPRLHSVRRQDYLEVPWDREKKDWQALRRSHETSRLEPVGLGELSGNVPGPQCGTGCERPFWATAQWRFLPPKGSGKTGPRAVDVTQSLARVMNAISEFNAQRGGAPAGSVHVHKVFRSFGWEDLLLLLCLPHPCSLPELLQFLAAASPALSTTVRHSVTRLLLGYSETFSTYSQKLIKSRGEGAAVKPGVVRMELIELALAQERKLEAGEGVFRFVSRIRLMDQWKSTAHARVEGVVGEVNSALDVNVRLTCIATTGDDDLLLFCDFDRRLGANCIRFVHQALLTHLTDALGIENVDTSVSLQVEGRSAPPTG